MLYRRNGMEDWQRGVLFFALFAVLAWSLVAFGTVDKVPTDSLRLQATTEVVTDADAHVGERVVVDGTVSETEPIIVRLSESNIREVVVIGVDRADLSVGDKVYVFGTLEEPTVVEADRVVVVEPWARMYTYAASFVGGLVVLGRVAWHWRLDTDEWVFVPRTDPTIRRRNND